MFVMQKSSEMGRKEFVAAWNQAFFTENGELNNATLDIEVALSFPGGRVKFALSGVTPRTRVNELARRYADSLADGAVAPVVEEPVEEVVETAQEMLLEEAQPSQPQSPVKEVVANEHIAYRNNRYLVQHYRLDGVDQFNIFNEGTGKVISSGSVTGRGILKGYREGQNGELEERIT